MLIRDRIKELRRVPANELRPNPKNWRTHPDEQANAMRGILSEIGYADAVLARELDDGSLMLIDGHLRCETTPDAILPVLIVDVTEAEADLILASHDPLAGLATTDQTKLNDLLATLKPTSEALQEMLADLAEQNGSFDAEEVDFPAMAAGDRSGHVQMSFTLTDDQATDLKSALAAAKAEGPFGPTGNENANGNALARIVEAYLAA
jgi:hypothetical protein